MAAESACSLETRVPGRAPPHSTLAWQALQQLRRLEAGKGRVGHMVSRKPRLWCDSLFLVHLFYNKTAESFPTRSEPGGKEEGGTEGGSGEELKVIDALNLQQTLKDLKTQATHITNRINVAVTMS